MNTSDSARDAHDRDWVNLETADLFNRELSEGALKQDDPELFGRPIPVCEWEDLRMPAFDPSLRCDLSRLDEAALEQALAAARLPPLTASQCIARWIITHGGMLTAFPHSAGILTHGGYRVDFPSDDVAPVVTVYRHGVLVIEAAY